MAKRAFVLTGDKRVTRMLNALGGKKAVEVSRKALRDGAKLALDEAKSVVRVKTGKFRRSLTVRAMKRSRKSHGYRVTQRDIQGKKQFYGAFQELGTKTIDATWQMRQAGKNVEDRAVDLYRSEIVRMIEEA